MKGRKEWMESEMMSKKEMEKNGEKRKGKIMDSVRLDMEKEREYCSEGRESLQETAKGKVNSIHKHGTR